jgi:hypothetical protein
MHTEARNESPLFTAENVIHVYTRAQAIADGVLIDVSELARRRDSAFPSPSPPKSGRSAWPGNRKTPTARLTRT